MFSPVQTASLRIFALARPTLRGGRGQAPRVAASYAKAPPAQRRHAAVAAGLGGVGQEVWGGNQLNTVERRKPQQQRMVCNAGGGGSTLEDLILAKNQESPVVIYSKSWCPFCNQVKALFAKLQVDAMVIELDGIVEEQDIMDTLLDLTGQRTVPNVFIGGNHIGGCDDTLQLNASGELKTLLTEAGAL